MMIAFAVMEAGFGTAKSQLVAIQTLQLPVIAHGAEKL